MPLPAFQKIFTGVYEVQKLQDHLAAILARITGQPDTPKQLLTGIKLGTTATDVPHQLGEATTNYIVTRRSSAAHVFDQQGANPVPNVSIRLLASAPVTINVLVF